MKYLKVRERKLRKWPQGFLDFETFESTVFTAQKMHTHARCQGATEQALLRGDCAQDTTISKTLNKSNIYLRLICLYKLRVPKILRIKDEITS